MGITREEIKNLLKEAIEPLERKLDNLNNGFQELKRLVDLELNTYQFQKQLKPYLLSEQHS